MGREFAGIAGDGLITAGRLGIDLSRCRRHDVSLADGSECLECAAEQEKDAAERAALLARWDTTDYEAAHRAEARRRAGLYEWLRMLEQFPLIRDAPLVPRPQWDQVRAWARLLAFNRPPGNLVLAGDRGQGKTWDILHAVVAAYGARFHGTAVYADRELWLRARPVSAFAEHDRDLLAQWQRADLLVIDDVVGDSPLGDRDADFMYLVLNRRCNAPDRPTVLISNFSDLRAAFGSAASDRLRSPSVTVVEYPAGESLRGGRS
jgi:DNA replication protein DnaC